MPDYMLRRGAPAGMLRVIRVSQYGSDDVIGDRKTLEGAEELIKQREDIHFLPVPDTFLIFDDKGRRKKRHSQKNLLESLWDELSTLLGRPA